MFVYAVTIAVPDAALRDEVLGWLEHDHLGEVVEAGALRGEATVLDGDPIRIECRYVFASREAFAAYEAGPAERLRADGRARFGAERGVAMSRTTGDLAIQRG